MFFASFIFLFANFIPGFDLVFSCVYGALLYDGILRGFVTSVEAENSASAARVGLVRAIIWQAERVYHVARYRGVVGQ